MIKPAYSFSFLLSINIFVWQNVLYFLDAPRTLQCLAASSYKITLSHPFLEGSTAEAVVQVAEPWFWGGPSPGLGRSTQSE